MTEPEKPASKRGKKRDDARESARDEIRDDDDGRDNGRNTGEDALDDPQESSPQDRSNVPGEPEPPVAENDAGSVAVGRRARSGPLVWLTMLVALVALGLASYPFWAHWLQPGAAEPAGPSASEFERLAGRVDTIRQDSAAEIATMREQLEELSSAFEADAQGPAAGDLADRIDQLSVRLERLQGERNTAIGGLRTRLEDLESEVGRRLEQFELRLSNVGSNLDRADRDLATRLLLMEVDSLFAIAQNHLMAGGDAGVALQAWERAMSRMAALDGVEFEGLKEAARREFSQLQAYSPPDLSLQMDRLFEMADSVAEWPANTIQPGSRSVEPGSDEGWRARLGRGVGGLVRVESVDREFLGPDEVDMARERVRGMLQTAALAIARSRPELARKVIGQAVDAAKSVFDSDAASVAEAVGRLEEIAANVGRVELPELGDSRAEISRLLGGMR